MQLQQLLTMCQSDKLAKRKLNYTSVYYMRNGMYVSYSGSLTTLIID